MLTNATISKLNYHFLFVALLVLLPFSSVAQTLISDISQLSIKGDAKILISEPIDEKETEIQKGKVTVKSGAVLIQSDLFANAEIIEEKVSKKISVKSEISKKNEIVSNSVEIKEVNESKISKPKSKIHFHSLPTSESILAGNLLKAELVRNSTNYSILQKRLYFKTLVFKSKTQSLSREFKNLKSNSYLHSILARPPPVV